MALHANSQLLVKHLQGLSLFEGRYANLRLVNYRGLKKRGVFSLVFRADDQVENKPVAIKFYDLHPHWAADSYRRAAFARESDILHTLIGVDRCLQLVQARSRFDLPVPISGGGTAVLPCEYFIVEWLDREIDDYFLKDSEAPEAKLRLFNEIVLAVEMLHRHDVFHRDLKADNLRATMEAAKRIVVAIDLGTAAKIDSGCVLAKYGAPVGAPIYAAPEAYGGGLAGNRRVASLNDSYALGCLLFELFNRDYFFKALRLANADMDLRLSAMAHLVPTKNDHLKQLTEWDLALAKYAPGVTPISIDGPGNMVPPAIAALLNEVVMSLTHFDYRRRMPLERVRARVWSSIKVLRNQAEAKRRIDFAKEMRRRKRARAQMLDQRFRSQRKQLEGGNANN
jgi:serine/threonine protein kinase